ncbi:MAG TPA: D-alanyl-D-alanine carboxypeptidase [Clostridiales bacterium]|nr:D-alanyl-D-alanine carboxypeptidase [Clostridiales bacterium]
MSMLIAIIFLSLNINITVYAEDDINAKAYVLMEASTGKVIKESNQDEKLVPASITKIMTILLIYEAISEGKIKLTDSVTVSEHAASMGGSQVFLEAYEIQTVADMLKCIVVASANDASVAMGEHIAGSETAFVEMMNKRAEELGMKNTHFENACGLDADNHYTSAMDVAIMSRELVTKYPEIHDITKIWQDSIIHKTRKGEKEFVLTNTNKLIKWYQYANGLKTGSTSKALYCVSGTAEKDGIKFIAVIMAAPDYKQRFREAAKLFDYGFANFKVVKGKVKNEKVGSIKVIGGKEDEADVLVGKDVSFVVGKGDKTEMKTEINMEKEIIAPAKAKTKVGEIIYKLGGNKIGKADLIIESDIYKAGFKDVLRKILRKYYL